MKFKKYAKDKLIEIVASSTCYREVLVKLNIKPAGGNYKTLHKAIRYLSLDTSHFNGKTYNLGRKFGRKRKIEDYLSNQYPINSYRLKNRLIEDKLLFYQCYSCFLTTWKNNRIPLELHHKNGNVEDNNLSNLELLCPNCHALTSNYRGKNIRSSLSSALS